MDGMVEEGVTLELRHYEVQSRPQGPEQRSNAHDEEHDNHGQGEHGKTGRVVVGARMWVAFGSK
jgi:hypothetical protein